MYPSFFGTGHSINSWIKELTRYCKLAVLVPLLYMEPAYNDTPSARFWPETTPPGGPYYSLLTASIFLNPELPGSRHPVS